MKNTLILFTVVIFLFTGYGCFKNNNSTAELKTVFNDTLQDVNKNSDSINAANNEYTEEYKIGNTVINIDVTEKESKIPVKYFNMHEDEVTSVKAGKSLLEKNGGKLVKLRVKGTRNITFTLNGERYSFDPNRIFTSNGLKRTLNSLGSYSEEGFKNVTRFVEHLLNEHFSDSGQIIVALHNNTPGAYSLASYMSGGEESNNAKEVYNNPNMSIDDFFVVTDDILYSKLKESKMNVVLQNNENAFDDGSLSIYCGLNNIMYVNVEAQRGHLNEQISMLETLNKILEETIK